MSLSFKVCKAFFLVLICVFEVLPRKIFFPKCLNSPLSWLLFKHDYMSVRQNGYSTKVKRSIMRYFDHWRSLPHMKYQFFIFISSSIGIKVFVKIKGVLFQLAKLLECVLIILNLIAGVLMHCFDHSIELNVWSDHAASQACIWSVFHQPTILIAVSRAQSSLHGINIYSWFINWRCQ